MSVLDQASPIREGEELARDKLAAYLHQHLEAGEGDLSVSQFPSGFSNLTYLLRLGTRELVLRRPPFGANIKSAHDMGREYRVLRGLHGSYGKVPKPLLYCEDEAVIGAPFYVMERVSGVILRNRVPKGMDLNPAVMAGISGACVDALADLHAFDYRADLADLGKPDGYLVRQVSGWIGRYQRARTDDLADMERVAAWLTDHQPATTTTALIHNDYKYDNLVLDPNNLAHIVAVLDWEMATIGDPLMDLGTSLGYWIEPGDPEALRMFGLTSLPGNLDRAGFLARYEQRRGHRVDHPVFYFAFGTFKIAVIVQQIYARFKQGHTKDPRFANLIHLVRASALLGARAIELGRINDLFPA